MTERILREYQRREREIPRERYSLDNPAALYTHTRLAQRIQSLLPPLKTKRIADIGCGTGLWLLEMVRLGADPANLFGIDLISSRIDDAKRRLPQAKFEVGDASHLALPTNSIDLAMQFMAFSSAPDAESRKTMAAQMLRILKPNGAILWYDLRVANPANRAVHPIGLAEIKAIFPACTLQVNTATLAPPLARLIAPYSTGLAAMLERIPALRTHYLILIRKSA